MTIGGKHRLAACSIILLAVLFACITKIADLDFWWHLKAGQLIATTHSIPRTDVFSYTAFGHEYIDHEWLFQLIAYGVWAAGGPLGIALMKCVLVAATLILVASYAMYRGADPLATGGLTLLAIGGGVTRMIERPELFSTLFAVITFVLADSYARTRDWRFLAALPLLCALWANVHAAVIVGLVIQVFFIRSLPQVVAFASSVLAACINPFGYRVLTVPFELTHIINSGLLNNEEWRHPTFAKAPVFFVAVVLAVLLVTRSRNLSHILVTLFLAYLSLRYIRNVGLFCTFLPLVVPPLQSFRVPIAALGAAAAAFVLAAYFPFERGVGISSYFPQRIASYVRERDLRGHMLNSYSFGGYLIWTLFPERRVFIDGRNEVYVPLLERLKAARTDNRAWNALLRDEQIEYALLDYVDDLDRVISFDRDGHPTPGFAPISATRFPRTRWALADFNDEGMIFVRRNGANTISSDYDAVFPEGRGYERQLVESGVVDRQRAIAQLQHKLAEDAACRRAQRILASLQNR